MSERSYIKDQDGTITHVRDTNDDGRRSYGYEYNDFVLPFVADKGPLVEIEDHDTDGTSTSYRPPEGLEPPLRPIEKAIARARSRIEP